MPADTEYRRGRNPMEIADAASSRTPTNPSPRAESRKSKWERAGMTREEYERGIKQIAEEKRRASDRMTQMDRIRHGQSNPGNGGY